jgi:hypothetical protein
VTVFAPAHIITDQSVGLVTGTLQSAVCTTPRFGTLERVSQGLLYRPRLTFWSVGRDEFSCPGLVQGPPTVELLAPGVQVASRYDFDAVSTSTPWTLTDPEGRLSVGSAGALQGDQGAQVRSGQRAAYLEVPLNLVPAFATLGEGYQPTSGGQQVRLPRPGGGGGLATTDDVILMAWSTTRSAADARVRLRRLAEAYEISLEGGGGSRSTSVVLPYGEHRLRLDGWAPDPSLGVLLGGWRLLVDGRAVAQLTWPSEADAQTRLVSFRAGAAADSAESAFPFDIDNVYVARASAPAPLIVHGDFESGAPSEWGEEAPAPQVTTSAAIYGQYGLELPLAAALRGTYRDMRPEQASELGLTFALRSISGVPEVGPSPLPVLAAEPYDSGGPAAVRLQLARADGAARYEFVVRLDDGTERVLPWNAPSSSVRHVAIQWLAASSGLAADGALRVFSDGVLVGELAGLANHAERVESLRVGASGPANLLANGTLAIDNLRAW